MKTLFVLYKNVDPENKAIVLESIMEHEDIAYCNAAIQRRPSIERGSYWIAKLTLDENGNEVSRTWGKHPFKTTKFIENVNDKVYQITILS